MRHRNHDKTSLGTLQTTNEPNPILVLAQPTGRPEKAVTATDTDTDTAAITNVVILRSNQVIMGTLLCPAPNMSFEQAKYCPIITNNVKHYYGPDKYLAIVRLAAGSSSTTLALSPCCSCVVAIVVLVLVVVVLLPGWFLLFLLEIVVDVDVWLSPR